MDRSVVQPVDDALQNAQLVDHSASKVTGIKTAEVPMTDTPRMPEGDLGDFLSRPVKIYELGWSSGAVATHIDPWALFLNNTNVKRKIDNFALLRGTLHVRFVINGTPFHYGSILASYEPRFGSLLAQSTQVDTTRHSQQPHVLIEPTRNETQELVLPFFSPFSFIDLTSATGAELGIIYFATLNLLQMANAATPDPVYVSVFAWMEDVDLRVPTSVLAATFTPQAGKTRSSMVKKATPKPSLDDERATGGPISTIASTVADIAGRLKDAPVIGPFAMAAQIGASAVGSIASIFGWSRPTVIEGPTYVKRLPVSMLAPTTWNDTSQLLSLDPKQELTVDPATTGADFGDELAFDNIASIYTYMTSFTWDVADAPDAVLQSMPVSPLVHSGSSTVMETTAVGFVAYPFARWTGSMTYKIRIIASAYHRGRLRLTYEPSGAAFVADSLNTTFTRILDIAEDVEYEFTIDWAQREPYLRNNPENLPWFHRADDHNGIWHISVFNGLTAPLITQGIEVQIWMKGGPSLELAMPHERVTHTTIFPLQMKKMSGPSAIIPDTTEEAVQVSLFEPATSLAGKQATHFGESVRSFRSLLKRFCFYKTQVAANYTGNDGNLSLSEYYIPHFPQPAGLYANAPDTTAALAKINYARNTYINYVASAFSGIRGSTRWKILANSGPANFGDDTLYVTRFNSTQANIAGRARTQLTAVPVGSANEAVSVAWMDDSTSGMAVVPLKSGTQMEVSSPGYNALRFYPSVGWQHNNTYKYDYIRVQRASHLPSTETNSATQADWLFSSAGEDFNCFFFSGAPPMYTGSTYAPA